MTTATVTRRSAISGAMAAAALPAANAAAPKKNLKDLPFTSLDTIRTELVMNIIVTCAKPEKMGTSSAAKDGVRDQFWPIIGGYFYGPNIKGTVVAGGADYPVQRPDGLVMLDAFYRLREDDGTHILIHNKGVTFPWGHPKTGALRLTPTFTTVAGPHQWLNEGTFLATLVIGPTFPPELAVAKQGEDDRLIQIHRVY